MKSELPSYYNTDINFHEYFQKYFFVVQCFRRGKEHIAELRTLNIEKPQRS